MTGPRAWLQALWCRVWRNHHPYPVEAASAPDDTMAVADAVAEDGAPPVQRAKPFDDGHRVDEVTAPIEFGVLGEVGCKHATLRYRPADPLAVGVDFTLDDVIWWFGRDLLHTAVIDRMLAGLADVQVYEQDGKTVVIRLSSPDGEISLTAPRQTLHDFLRATYAVVRRGRELVDVDAELADIVGEA